MTFFCGDLLGEKNCISVQIENGTGIIVELYEPNPQMGQSYWWHSDCDELFARSDYCVCISTHASSRDGYTSSPAIHHTPSDCVHCTNSANPCIYLDEEQGTGLKQGNRMGFQFQFFKLLIGSFVLTSKVSQQ